MKKYLFLISIIIFCSIYYNKTNKNKENQHIKSGNSYIKKGKYKMAINLYKKSIKKDITNAIAYNNLGITYYRNKEYINALSSYDKSIQINSKYIEVYYNRSNAFIELQQ
jgi:tetratricopeptide (TPR) repeat protein